MQIKKISERINLISEKTNKFKTFALSFYFHMPLNEEEASLNALLPYTMKMGSKNYKDITAVSNTLENLYGGMFDCNIRKKGEDQILGFNFEFVSPEYIKDNDYLKNVFNFIFDIIFNPLIKDNGFLPEYTEREKLNLTDYIEGIINDKKEYAGLKCTQEMCKGENYAIFEYGSVDKIKNITPQQLYSQYKKIISESRIDIFVTGNIDFDEVESRISELKLKEACADYPRCEVKEPRENINEVTEEFDVAQGKISMGFTVGKKAISEKKYALSVFNSIFGSGAHSKLFNNVREKLSLCYYAYSRIDAFKGIMTVNSGVEFKNFKAAHDEILVQLEDIKKGNISDVEIDSSKKAVINSLRSLNDSPFSMENYFLNGLIKGTVTDVDDYIDNINKVTKEDITDIAKDIKLDTVYYLTGGKK